MKGILIFIFSFVSFTTINGYTKPKIQIGVGNFEGLNIGAVHTYQKTQVFYGYGNDLNLFQQGFYNVLYLGGGRKLLQRKNWAKEKLSLNMKLAIWNIENPSNIFSAVSFIPELHYKVSVFEKHSLNFYSGYAYSSVFRYKRKGFYEVGWPDEWMPNFGISFQYTLK